MTDQEWHTELTAALAGTDWIVQAAKITLGFPHAFAALQNRVTNVVRAIKLPLGTFPTPEARAAEIRRQLAAR
jgi:hypothetical protein